MTELDDRAMDLFGEVVGLSPEQRGERLDAECAALPELRARVEELLADDREAEAHVFPDTSPLHPEVPTKVDAGDADPPELPGPEAPTKIGQGGMGVVWRVRDLQFGRLVALKVLRAEHCAIPDRVRRFFVEARITAQLAHPNIVPVHDVGRLPDGRPYFTMKLIEGKKLGDYLHERPGRADLLRVFVRICEAMAFAHRKGVIHRDLKPGNVMVGQHGEVLVIDWGVAKVLAESDTSRDDAARKVCAPEDSGHTQAGGVMGTLAYMPPEQANGWIEKMDPRSDVFGLGGILYTILTGRAPYDGSAWTDVLRQAGTGDLADAHARLAACGADADLVALARACLAAEPSDRLPDAAAVERRLKEYLASVQDRLRRAEQERAAAEARAEEEKNTAREAENARRAAEKARRWLRLVVAGLACALLASVAAGVFAWVAYDARLKREAAELAALILRREKAIDRALADAMGGDLAGAEQAIKEAEEAGASKGQVRMLRGQIALHRGRSRDALGHLEEAVRELPESVAARGMLAAAYASDGQWERYDKTIREMAQLTPSTPEDFLFKGYAEANLDPALGLRTIQQGFDRRPMTGVALLLRAEVRAFHAQDTDNPTEAEGAVQDARYAKELLRKNPAAIWVSLNANLAAAGVYEHRAEPEKRRAAMDAARLDAEALKDHTALPEAVVYRWLYYREVGEEEKVLEELKKASEVTDHVYVAFCYALTLYRRGGEGDFEKALAVLENKRGSYNDRLLPFVLAEDGHRRGLPDWEARARAAADAFAERSKDGLARMNAQSVLWLLGRKDDAVNASKELLKQPDRFYTLRREPILECVKYCADEIDAVELLKKVKGRQWDQCLAHYSIGIMTLAQGKRHEARVHFDKVVRTRAFIWGTYDLSWVFHARLAKNSAWPAWIPQRDGK